MQVSWNYVYSLLYLSLRGACRWYFFPIEMFNIGISYVDVLLVSVKDIISVNP